MEETKEQMGGRKKKSSAKNVVGKKVGAKKMPRPSSRSASAKSASRSKKKTAKTMTAKKMPRKASTRMGSMKSMDSTTTSNDNPTGNILVGLVYADWCGHCQQLKPEWAKMKQDLSPMRNIDVVEINSDDMPSALDKVRNRYGFEMEQPQGYPHIFRWNGGPNVTTYGGARTSSALGGWAKTGNKAGGNRKAGGNKAGGNRKAGGNNNVDGNSVDGNNVNANKNNHSISSNAGGSSSDDIGDTNKSKPSSSNWFMNLFK